MQGGGRDFVQEALGITTSCSARCAGHLDDGRILRERRRQEKVFNESLMHEIEEARDIQRRMLPAEMPSIAGCDIQATWQPANDVGGDYFDALDLGNNHVALCMADVSGKGLPAALLMSHAQATMRAFAHDSEGPA